MSQWTYSAPSNGYQFRITLTDTNVNPGGNNTSQVAWTIEHYQGTTRYNGAMNRYLTVDGTNVYAVNGTYDTTVFPTNSWWTVASGTSAAITHTADGTKTISIHFYWSGTSGGFGPGTVDQTWNFTLQAIPRYAAISSFTSSAITDVGFTLNVVTDVTCDQVEYSVDNGSNYTTVSGDFTTKALMLGGTYRSETLFPCYVRVRRKDSQLKTTSSLLNVTTLGQNTFVGFF